MSPIIIEIIALVILILSVVDGWHRGFLRKLYGLVKFIVLIILTIVLAIGFWYVLPLDPGTREGVAFLLALIVSAVALGLIEHILKIVDKIPVLKTINRIGGALVGLVLGVITVWVAILVIGYLSEVAWCRSVSEAVSQSFVLSKLQMFTPFDLFK
ncbi:MAG: CvpA family protein [Eubacterium sp.]|nr:CvpA family protein [Eubacterium sp.]